MGYSGVGGGGGGVLNMRNNTSRMIFFGIIIMIAKITRIIENKKKNKCSNSHIYKLNIMIDSISKV